MSTSLTRLLLTAATTCLAAATLTSASASASASATAVTDGQPESTGSVGEVDVVVDGEPVRQAPIAPCDVDGEQDNDSGRVNVGDVATYWGGETGCSRDAHNHAHADISGRYFATDVLREWGGPRIKVSSFKLSCETMSNGSSGHVELRGIRGFEVPDEIPPNYTVTIPGRIEGAAPLAEVVVNEVIEPDGQPDGSMTMHALRMELFPEGGGPNRGDITLGTASCDPYGG